jgi:hypothetical protein
LSQGSHRFEVKAIDTSGNSDQTPAIFSWSIAHYIRIIVSGQTDANFLSFSKALSAIPSGVNSTIMAKSMEFEENITVSSCSDITMMGGYDSNFFSKTGNTSIYGTLTINCGTVVVSGIAIR